MIERHLNSRKQGDAGMGVAIGWFATHGYTVCIPLTDSQCFDLVVENNGILQKVSVKTTTQKVASGSFKAELRTIGSNMYRTKIKKFSSFECDLLFIACADGANYLIPTEKIKSINSITLNQTFDEFKL